MIKDGCNKTQHPPRHPELVSGSTPSSLQYNVSASTHELNHKCCAMGHYEILKHPETSLRQNDDRGGKS